MNDLNKNQIDKKISSKFCVQHFVFYYFIIILIMIFLAFLFLNSVYVTRNYIIDAEKFWEKVLKNDKYLDLQNYCAITGAYLFGNSIISFIINIYIIFKINLGGIKITFQFSNYTFLVFQCLLFLYSCFTLYKFTNIIYLFIVFIVFSFLNLLISVFYFLLVKRYLEKEIFFRIL